MPVVNIGTAVNLLNALKLSLIKKGLSFDNCIAFISDNTNVMKGARSGVQKLIHNECPHLSDVRCICHLADLTIKAGMKTLPIEVDQLFVDVFYYFLHSSKRKQQFADNWHSLFSSEPTIILKHCTTRWLSLLHCVNHFIDQFDGLKSYFLSCEEAETVKVKKIIDTLHNPLTRPILQLLSYILPSIDKFNKVLQKSKENTTCQLFQEMSRLIRLYALKANVILAAGNDLRTLSLDSEGQVPDENLGIGNDKWVLIAQLEEEADPKPLYSAVRQFYVATIKKMFKKFPFNDSLLKKKEIINPEATCSNHISAVIDLSKRFQQIGLTDSSSLDKLWEEFMDFKLSPADLPCIDKYKSADKIERSKAGNFWWEVGKLKTLDWKARFPLLVRLMTSLLTIPVSN